MSIQNTTARHPTYFLAAVELIEKAQAAFSMPSENWAYPTKHRIGTQRDTFYAEVWQNGMDWQNNYWVIWEAGEDPICEPLLVFDDHKVEEQFKESDHFIEAQLAFMRDKIIAEEKGLPFSGDISIHKNNGLVESCPTKPKRKWEPATSLRTRLAWDETWCFSWTDPSKVGRKDLVWTGISHASQRPVEFWANSKYMPLRVHRRIRPANAIDPPNYRKIVNDLLGKDDLVPLLMGLSADLDRVIEARLKLRQSYPSGSGIGGKPL